MVVSGLGDDANKWDHRKFHLVRGGGIQRYFKVIRARMDLKFLCGQGSIITHKR